MNNITEKWARTAPAGPELDRVCAEWMGFSIGETRDWRHHVSTKAGWKACSPSTRWSDAGPLLEAMDSMTLSVWNDLSVIEYSAANSIIKGSLHISAPTPQLAIARACAVLVARRITRDDLGGM